MKKFLKIFLIIFAVLMFGLMLLKCSGNYANSDNTSVQTSLVENELTKEPLLASTISNTDITTLSANASFTVYSSYIVGQQIAYWSDTEYITLASADDDGYYELQYINGSIAYSLGLYSMSNYTFTIYYPSTIYYYYLVMYDSSVSDPVKPYVTGSTTTTLFSYVFNTAGSNKVYTNQRLYLSNNDDYLTGYEAGESYGYQNGYSIGYNVGYEDGKAIVIGDPTTYGLYSAEDYNNLLDNYNTYKELVEEGNEFTTSGFKLLLNQIIGTPYNAMRGMFNFEFMGVNLFNLFSFLFTAALVGYLLKKII